MSMGLKANADGSGAIQIGGSDAITITSGLNTTFVGTVTSTGVITSPTGALYPLVSGTAVTASGTSVNFTGIPSTAKRVTVMINGLSFAAAGAGVLQIGSGSLTTTGYTSYTMSSPNTAVNAGTTQTNGFGRLDTANAAGTQNGMYILTNITGNTWSFMSILQRSDSVGQTASGFIALGGVLDRLSLVATTSTFDAGTVNILWE